MSREHQGHAHQPQDGTMYTRTGLPVDQCRPSTDYPVDAMCLHCGVAIVREGFVSFGLAENWRIKYTSDEVIPDNVTRLPHA